MRTTLFGLLFFILSATTALATTYNYMTAEQLKEKMTSGEELIIMDIQVKDEFDQHHIKGSLATYAYPVKTDDERAAIDIAIAQHQQTSQPVVIVCPRGKGGAKRSYDYMQAKNVPQEKLYILEKGMAGWPYPGLVE